MVVHAREILKYTIYWYIPLIDCGNIMVICYQFDTLNIALSDIYLPAFPKRGVWSKLIG